MDSNNVAMLIDDVDEILTDSAHPIDEKQARKLSLMMLRQIMNVQLEIQREIADWKADVSNRRTVVNDRLDKLEKVVEDVVEAVKDLPAVKKTVETVERTVTEYPSITWLLRYKTTPTMRWIVAFLFVLYVVIKNYPAMATWLGLPPLP